jgi:hypothetical protein
MFDFWLAEAMYPLRSSPKTPVWAGFILGKPGHPEFGRAEVEFDVVMPDVWHRADGECALLLRMRIAK